MLNSKRHSFKIRVLSSECSEMRSVRELREKVFVHEQKVDPMLEWDDRDGMCLHVSVALNSKCVASARLNLENCHSVDGFAKIERVVVDTDFRGIGFGLCLMDLVEACAAFYEPREYRLGAQVAVIPFYEKLGYQACGEIFDDAGIPHQMMVKISSKP